MNMKLETFDDVLKSIERNHGKREFHLLLGNGFSMAYDSTIFSYAALNEFIEKIDNPLLTKLFNIVNTKNFELVMQQLDNFAALLEAFGSDEKLKTKVEEANAKLKASLLDAIQALHPEHVFKIPQERCDACGRFLRLFLGTGGHVFTTNYDLLLYWVLMRNQDLMSVDGFGRDRIDGGDEYTPKEEREYSELRWGKHRDEQKIHYLHGTLPFFDIGVEIEKEEYTEEGYLLENIKERVGRKEYPIFVTAGNGREKLTHIKHNPYLSFCYDQLTQINGSIVTFGFNFGEYDNHILGAINKAAKKGTKSPPKLRSIYIGVYSKENQAHIENIASDIDCKVHIFDAKTANVWG
jgi:hypothetical protein